MPSSTTSPSLRSSWWRWSQWRLRSSTSASQTRERRRRSWLPQTFWSWFGTGLRFLPANWREPKRRKVSAICSKVRNFICVLSQTRIGFGAFLYLLFSFCILCCLSVDDIIIIQLPRSIHNEISENSSRCIRQWWARFKQNIAWQPFCSFSEAPPVRRDSESDLRALLTDLHVFIRNLSVSRKPEVC